MTSKILSTANRAQAAALAAFLALTALPALAAGEQTATSGIASTDAAGAPLPPSQDRAKALDDMFSRLRKAANPAEAAQIKTQIRALWSSSGSATVDLLLARDAQAALAHDLDLRRRLLEAVTYLAPENSEGWNRRADLDYSQQRMGDAMADLGHVLAIEPRQFDALESVATLLKETGRNDLALRAFRQLQTIDPTSANIKSEIDDLARKVEGEKI